MVCYQCLQKKEIYYKTYVYEQTIHIVVHIYDLKKLQNLRKQFIFLDENVHNVYHLNWNQDKNCCTARESNPGRKNGKLAWYHYTSSAHRNKRLSPDIWSQRSICYLNCLVVLLPISWVHSKMAISNTHKGPVTRNVSDFFVRLNTILNKQ